MREKQDYSSRYRCEPVVVREKFTQDLPVEFINGQYSKNTELHIREAEPRKHYRSAKCCKVSTPISNKANEEVLQTDFTNAIKLRPAQNVSVEPKKLRVRIDSVTSIGPVDQSVTCKTLLSPISGKTFSLLSSLQMKKQEEIRLNPVEVIDLTKDIQFSAGAATVRRLLHIDLTSPLGEKLQPFVSEHFNTNKVSNRDYDRYCSGQPEDDGNRALRSQMAHCDDLWYLTNIHYVKRDCHGYTDHKYTFGRQERRDRFRTLRSRLNKRSRRLLRRLKPCSVLLKDIFSYLSTRPSDNAAQGTDRRGGVGSCPNSIIEQGLSAVDNCVAPEPRLTQLKANLRSPKTSIKPFMWEDLVCDAPKVLIEVPELVDLTTTTDEEVMIIPLPSPTALLTSAR